MLGKSEFAVSVCDSSCIASEPLRQVPLLPIVAAVDEFTADADEPVITIDDDSDEAALCVSSPMLPR